MDNVARILVVDDDPKVRKTLADILKIKGYAVVSAENGAAGVAETQRIFVNMVLLDLSLPDMTGIEVMEQIKAESPLTEIIILTGHASLQTAVEAINRGAFSYLLKPYDIEKLLRHIARALRRQEMQQEVVRLSSFPVMNPYPVLEISADGVLSYLNPAAAKIFPDLVVRQPVLNMLGDLSVVLGGEAVVREFAVDERVFEQHMFPVEGSDRVRIYMMDITKRKTHEARLKYVNSLLLVISRINEYLLVAESEDVLYRFVCEALQSLDGIVAVIIALKFPDYVLKPVAWAGRSEEADVVVPGLRLRWDRTATGGGVMGAAVCEEKPVVVSDVAHDLRYAPWREIVERWEIRSAEAVPLTVEGETLGVLAIYSERQNAFDEQTTEFMIEVANDIAIGVHSMRLAHNLRTTLAHMRESMESTVEAIATMVELRDPYTAGHERRVAQLACAIGREMGLPERQVEGLHVIGYLHDLGKIAVPAEILSKPAQLTEIELAMVQAHAQSGYDILKRLDFPWPVAQAVLQHHERLDGSGYPQGLKEPDIILEAKILMVADMVEAMLSHRPYRSAAGFAEVNSELLQHRGTLYDAQVVDACIRLFNEQGFAFDNESGRPAQDEGTSDLT